MLKENRMLKSITNMFKKDDEVQASQEPAEQSNASHTETLKLEIDTSEAVAKVQELQAQLETYSANLQQVMSEFEAFKTEANNLIAQADAEKAELKNVVEALQAEKAEMAAQVKQEKLAARKEKVVALIGDERADALMSVTENMDDAAFNAVLTAMSVSTEVEAKSKMFTEQGVDAEADSSKVADESQTMKLLKQKYQDAAQA